MMITKPSGLHLLKKVNKMKDYLKDAIIDIIDYGVDNDDD